MIDGLVHLLFIAGAVYLIFAFVSAAKSNRSNSTWQDSMRGGMHAKDCGDCAAGRPCRIRDSWEVQR